MDRATRVAVWPAWFSLKRDSQESMTWLNAALAFALSMLLFATIVSMIVESIHRVFRLRRQGLEWMLERLYADVVKLRPDLIPLGGNVQSFLDTLTCNDTPPPRFRWTPRWWARLIAPRQLQALTELDFGERLAATDIGQQLKKIAAAEREQVINGLVQRFEYFGKGAGTYFGHRAKALSVAVAIALAFAVNIDAIRLVNSFLTNPELADRVIAQAEAIRADYKRREADLDALAVSAPQDEQRNLEKAKQNLKEARQDLDSWIEQGLPIGWSYYPTCLKNEIDARCATGGRAAMVPWFFSTLLGGLLIGLGGPFWFDLCSKMMSVVQIASSRSKPAATNGETATAGSRQPRTPAQAFDAAILLETAARRAIGRVPLLRTGMRWRGT